MKAGWLLVALIVTARPAAGGGVEVEVRSGRVDLKLPGAPLSEVLERLANALSFKLVREEGVANPLLPALEFRGRTPVETVLGVLEGQGLNYAITMDASGSRVESLLLTATKSSAPSARPTPPTRAFGPSMRMPPPTPEEEDDDTVIEPPELVLPPEEEPTTPPPVPPPPGMPRPGVRPVSPPYPNPSPGP